MCLHVCTCVYIAYYTDRIGNVKLDSPLVLTLLHLFDDPYGWIIAKMLMVAKLSNKIQ